MSNIVTIEKKEEKIIDTEVLNQKFPVGQFIGLVNRDAMDENSFDCYCLHHHIDNDIENWTQLIVGENDLSYSVSDGETFWVCNRDVEGVCMKGEIVNTRETAVFQAEDVVFLNLSEQNNLKNSLCGVFLRYPEYNQLGIAS